MSSSLLCAGDAQSFTYLAVIVFTLCAAGEAAYGLEFISATLDKSTGVLAVTFDADVSPGSVDATKFHIREQGSATGGIALTGSAATTNGTRAFLALTDAHKTMLEEIDRPRLAIDRAAITNSTGDPFDATFDISTAFFLDSTSVHVADTGSDSLEFNNDGTRMFIGDYANPIREYARSVAFDASTASFLGNSDELSDSVGHFAFNSNGSRLFVSLNDGLIGQHDMPAPFDISNLTFAGSLDVSENDSSLYDIFFGADGNNLFITGGDNEQIYQYRLLVALATATGLLAAQPGGWTGAFSGDGEATVPDAWPPLGDAASAGLLLRYAFAQSVMLNPADGAFVTTWKTDSDNEPITIPVGGAAGNYTVNWGDGTVTAHTTDATHAYAAAGNHTVSISGDFTRIYLISGAHAPKLVSIDQWGDIGWESMESAFYGASSMEYKATDAPDLSGVTNMNSMFSGATSFNGDISSWDVSKVTDMSGMFRDATSFNKPLSSWDVSKVTGMSGMFRDATSFNQDLNDWDISKVTHMNSMFSGATSFNKPLSSWDVSKVTSMSGMFRDATSFNKPLSSWNVSQVINMNNMFIGATSFNGNVSPWNVSQVTYMHSMFSDATSFNQDLNDWDVSKVTGMSGMFRDATSFNKPLSSWNASRVTSMHSMFRDATAFNGDISSWNVSQVTRMPNMFHAAAAFNGDISSWDVSKVTDMSGMFRDATSFNKPLSSWDVSKVTGMSGMFRDATSFNQDLNDWDVSKVTHMNSMFSGATSFNGNLSAWNVSRVTSMHSMFRDATAFNKPLSSWNVSQVINMNNMFIGATSFNGNVSPWNVSQVTYMHSMFSDATSFNQDLNDWDVSKVTGMSSMFRDATSFNKPLSSWNVSQVINMINMFIGATSFNGNVSSWDVSQVTDMSSMFGYATAFNQPLSGWDVSQVDDMNSMFYGATSFNGNVSPWNVSQVADMNSMFDTASSFNQDLSLWNVSQVADMSFMFYGASSFNQPLNDWDVSSVTNMDGMFSGASDFDQNLGNWYVTINSTSIDRADVPGTVGTISAQNAVLDGHGPVYGIVSGADSGRFEIDGRLLIMNSTDADKDSYTVNVNAPGDSVFEDGNNWSALTVTLTGSANTPPTVTSIVRSDPAGATTSERTLVFAVTFSEDVTGVDAGDFALSPDSTGGGSASGQFTQASTPALAIPDNAPAVSDTITVTRAGTATAVSVAVDITHTFIGDLTVELVAPDGTVQTLHDHAGGPANDIDRTYTPDFDGTGIAGDWILRVSDRIGEDTGTLNSWTLTIDHDGAGSPVTGLTGSGYTYLVTVSAARDGTYNLDVAQDGGIADAADNPLAGTNPTGADHTYTVSTIRADTAAPAVTSIVRSDPAGATTSERTLVFAVTFSEDVTGVDAGDFALSPDSTGTGSMAGLTGSGSQYLVTVSAARDGTYNLDITQDGGIADAAGNPLAGTNPTGADHTYTVSTIRADTAAPTVTSIVRSDPAGATTSERTLVFAVTFSEDVTGVDAGDFALSPDSTGTGSMAGLTGSGSQYLVNVSAARDGTYNLDITQDGGIADAADNPLAGTNPTGADHTYAVDTAAPTVTSIVRSDPAGATTSERILVFAVTFSEDVTGVDAGDFALSPDSTGTGSMAGLTGSGSQYLVNVSAARDGTYNLDITQDGGIADAAGNPLAGTNPTGADHTYAVAPYARTRPLRPSRRS